MITISGNEKNVGFVGLFNIGSGTAHAVILTRYENVRLCLGRIVSRAETSKIVKFPPEIKD